MHCGDDFSNKMSDREDGSEWKSLEKKTGPTVDDEEFDNFMLKVDEVKKLLEGLNSRDNNVAENTMKLVDDFLGENKNSVEEIDESQLKVKSCKTVINQKAFDEMKSSPNQQEVQSPEAFMKSCEEDAKRRSEERRFKKEASETLKKKAVAAFHAEEYEKALSYYNKAIDEYRGSAHLYTSRALTCLRLKLYQRVLEDCGLVLRNLNSTSLKALLYKAKALQALGQDEEAQQIVQEALQHHPTCEDVIRDYISKDTTNLT